MHLANSTLKIKFSILLFCFSLFAEAQGLKGTLTNEKGEPLPFVTIYCITAKIGTNSNLKGIYELKLPKGTHQISFQSIDYKTLVKTIEISNDWLELNLILQEQTYALKELTVSSNNENPANFIMRKAIAAAPYYRRQVLSYSSKVYVKGTGKVDEAPRLLRGLIKDQGIEVGRSYVTESINELQFKQPSTYQEKVISVKSSMPFKDAPEPMRMARGSWYEVGNGEIVSPLSPQAFSVYNFVLEGSFYENGKEINKIQVKPKRKGNDVFTGYLYIVENLWCLHSCVLIRQESGMTVNIKTSYKAMPDYPFVWMPVTYDIAAMGDYFGVKGSFRYLASVSNYKIKLNPNVAHNWVQKVAAPPALAQESLVRTEKKLPEKTKNQLQIEALMAKEKLSKAEMLKLASKMKKEAERETQTLQIENDSSELVIDSLAYQRDSAFWNSNRPVPLLKEEQQSFSIKDTTKRIGNDSLSKKKHASVNFGALFLSGDSINNKAKTNYISYTGLLAKPSVNTVEGFAIQSFVTIGNLKPNFWRYKQFLKMPLERLAFQTTGELTYRFDPTHFGNILFRGGTIIQDYNPKGIGVYTDAFQLLILKNNFSKLFQQEYFGIGAQREIANGLNMDIQLMAANRFSLENINRYKNQEGTDGITVNTPIGNIAQPSYKTFQYQISMSYRPFQTYKMRNNKKQYLQNQWPILSAQYKAGMDQKMQFQKIDIGLDQNVYLRHWLILSYQLHAGIFLDTSNVHFADYQHFAGNQSFIYEGKPQARFQQLPYYNYSTTANYQSLLLQFQFKKLLLRQLPHLNLMDFKEQLYFNILRTGNHPLYYETGYRIDQVANRISLGVNFHFIENSYKGTSLMMTGRF